MGGPRSGEERVPAGPAAPSGAGRPAPPQGDRDFWRLPFNLKGSMSNDPLGLEEKELKYLVTVLNLRKFVKGCFLSHILFALLQHC